MKAVIEILAMPLAKGFAAFAAITGAIMLTTGQRTMGDALMSMGGVKKS